MSLSDLDNGRVRGCLGDLGTDESALAKSLAKRFAELTSQEEFADTWPLRRDAARELIQLILRGTLNDPRSGPITRALNMNLDELVSVLQSALTEPSAVDDHVQRLFDPDSWAYRPLEDSGDPGHRPFPAKAHWKVHPQPMLLTTRRSVQPRRSFSTRWSLCVRRISLKSFFSPPPRT